jgi:hypothetical protein
LNVDFFLDLIDSFDCDITSLLKTISNLERVDTLVEKLLGLLKESTGQDNDSCGSISDFIVLRLGKFNQKSGDLMLDLVIIDIKYGIYFTSIFSRIVAPSLVTKTSPSGL